MQQKNSPESIPETSPDLDKSSEVAHETIFLPQNFDSDGSDAGTLNLVNGLIRSFLDEHALHIDRLLFAGYVAGRPKEDGGEFATDTPEIYEYYLGNFQSMQAALIDEDEETKEERWMVNPLKYALQSGGILGVYDADALENFILQDRTDEEFGTYVCSINRESLEKTKKLTIDFKA